MRSYKHEISYNTVTRSPPSFFTRASASSSRLRKVPTYKQGLCGFGRKRTGSRTMSPTWNTHLCSITAETMFRVVKSRGGRAGQSRMQVYHRVRARGIASAERHITGHRRERPRRRRGLRLPRPNMDLLPGRGGGSGSSVYQAESRDDDDYDELHDEAADFGARTPVPVPVPAAAALLISFHVAARPPASVVESTPGLLYNTRLRFRISSAISTQQIASMTK
ncbi:hypothetical protein F5X96DRAFT_673690 [Biscogniauxia mediterranea]|nr:hypothetical protein F5X96DRAFT_673690 [Biscogniauxia mediterranea]